MRQIGSTVICGLNRIVTVISRDNRRDLRKVCTEEIMLKLHLLPGVMKKYLQNHMALSLTI